jgi:predicted DCC family thiol-disulfide oxidoreductase YuxK
MHVGIAVTLLIGFFSLISIVSFLGLLPTLFWDKLFGYLERVRNFKLKIYYDSDCGFCRKIVYYVKTFFLLPGTKVIPAPEDPEILSLMQKENSFVVEDARGRRFFRAEAIFAIIKASPIVFPFALAENIPGLQHKIVDRVYNFIALRRHAVCPIRPKTPETKKRIYDFSLPLNIVASFFIVYVLAWNVQYFYPQLKVPQELGYKTGIWQKWFMFSPSPPKRGGWHVFRGTLSDKNYVNLLNPDEPVSFDEPEIVAFEYDYLLKNIIVKFERERSMRPSMYYASYLCRKWDLAHEKKLSRVEIYYMARVTSPPGEPDSEVKRINIINYSCTTGRYSSDLFGRQR